MTGSDSQGATAMIRNTQKTFAKGLQSMQILRRALMGILLMAAAACTNANRFDGSDASAGSATGAGTAAAGSASDPTSPAFFAEAVGDRVLFEVDQATLTDAARATLEGQARWLIANADFNATIEGHADEQGTREYNLALGARRANTAREFLVSRGVAGDRLKVVSFGKERPIEVCSNEACYAQNRRSVTVLASGLTG